jgi:hypothetical protein
MAVGREQVGRDGPAAATVRGGKWKIWVGRLALTATSLALCLVVLEGFVRCFVTVRIVGPAFTTYDPVLGKRLKPNLSVVRTTPDFTMRLTTNSLGYRGPEPTTPRRGTLLCVGDSFTMGYGVEDGEEFPRLLQRALAARFGSEAPQVLNTGMGGNGNGRWIRFLRDEAARHEPALIVLQVCHNDFTDNLDEGLYTLGPSGALVEHPVPPPTLSDRLQGWVDAVPGLSYSHLLGLVAQSIVRHRDSRGAAAWINPASDELTYALIDRAVDICREHDWPVIVITEGLDGDRLDRMRGRCRRSDVPLIAVPVQPCRPDLYHPTDGHWNAAGHAYVAARLAERLLTGGAIRHAAP